MLSVTKESRSSKSILSQLRSSVEPPSVSPPSKCFPENSPRNDNATNFDKISSERKINKQKSSSSERHDSPQEIAEGNCVDGKREKNDEKIDTPKKHRFFDLKRTAESASNKISSISPSRIARSLTPRLHRKSATNHKLSQLERQSNLFIRDGSESRTNKQEDLTNVFMESEASANAKHQQNSPEGSQLTGRSKKSSLISPFAFKIPFAAAETSRTNLKNLCKNFSLDLKQKALEIDIVNDEANNLDENMITNAPDVPNDNCTMENFVREDEKEEEFNLIVDAGEPLDMLSKPEFNSNVFKNIPVRPRKGQVPHMENYCLFDPSVDFCSEKELRKKIFTTELNFPTQNFRNFHVAVYDISEHNERLAHHNYYEIDPELLEKDEATNDHNRIAENPAQISIITRKSSSSSSSSDYPVETTPSSTVTIESMDNEAVNLSINQINVVESAINVVTVTGAKKKSPQFDKITKQTARNSPLSTDNANQAVKGKSTKINLPFHNGTLSFDPLKPSHSLSQLQNISVRQQQIADGDYNIEINNRTTIQLRRNVGKVRPMSSESLDSGFTTPSPPPNEAPLTQSLDNSSGDNNQVDNSSCKVKEPVKSESTVLTHCDNVQQLIEVSDDFRCDELNGKRCQNSSVLNENHKSTSQQLLM